jgi:hypothetical protein
MKNFERTALLVAGDFDVLQRVEQGERLEKAFSLLSYLLKALSDRSTGSVSHPAAVGPGASLSRVPPEMHPLLNSVGGRRIGCLGVGG